MSTDTLHPIQESIRAQLGLEPEEVNEPPEGMEAWLSEFEPGMHASLYHQDEGEGLLDEGKRWGTMMDRIMSMMAEGLKDASTQTYGGNRLSAKAWKEIMKDPRVVKAAVKVNEVIYDELHKAMQTAAIEAAREAGHKSIFDK